MMQNNKKDNWYKIDDVDLIDSPALVIYLDRVKENITQLKGMISEVNRLRPHVKTHKTKEVSLLLFEAGITKFKCATIAEAEMLGSIKAPDVLLAYQPVGPKVQRLIQLIKNYPDTQFSCLVDDLSAAKYIATKAKEESIIIPVYIDLNIGMNRTGIAPGKALELYIQCTQLKGIRPVGLHAYDGHIHDADIEIRKKKCDDAFAPVQSLKEAIISKGFPEPVIVAGGSPTYPIHAKREKVECSPGTFIFWDAGYQQGLPEQPFLPAALVISRVISHPDKNSICTDLGHKSIAAENPLTKRVYFITAPELQIIGQSEEHLMGQSNKASEYKIGDVLYGIPYHICPTCALYDRAIIIQDGKVAGEWKIIARDKMIIV
jgi:D-serine deaminase-like pyridoxal phosphate-dependent protein